MKVTVKHKKATDRPDLSLYFVQFIPKTEDVNKLEHLPAYHPLRLTHVGYKAIIKVLAARVRSVVEEIVAPHQICTLKGRSLVTRTQVARSILECSDSLEQAVPTLEIDLQ